MYRLQIEFSRRPADCRLNHSAARNSRQTVKSSDIAAEELREQQRQQQHDAEQIKESLESIQYAIQELEERRQQSLSELQQIAVELAVLAASHVVYAELDRESLGVEELVAKAIAQLPLQEAATIRLNPSELQRLQTTLADGPTSWDEKLIQLVPDATIEPGGLRLETVTGRIVLSDVESRLAEIREQWMEHIDDTKIERRKVSGDAKPVRRFPDRRETA